MKPDSPSSYPGPGAGQGLDEVTRLLNRLHDRLDTLEAKVDGLAPALEGMDSLPDALATGTDIFDEEVARLGAKGVDVDARVRSLLALLEKVSDPTTLTAMEQAMEMAPQLPGMSAMAVDVLDEEAHRLMDEGVDLAEIVSESARAAIQMVRSGALGPGALNTIGELAYALSEAGREPPAKIGPLGMLSALRDPDVQRGMGFLVTMGRVLGQRLNHAGSPPGGRLLPQQSDP